MAAPFRVVVDTNVLVSALLSSDSLPRRAIRSAMEGGILLASQTTLSEIEEVLLRDKFGRWLSMETRRNFLASYRQAVQLISIVSEIRDCRDPNDNKFLELAIDGQADVILTGDDDLLALDAFRGVRILTPRAFLEFAGKTG